jgi:hypothetical protein
MLATACPRPDASPSSSLLSLSISILVLVLAALPARAQLTILRVNAPQTDPAIEAVHGPNIAAYAAHTESQHRLLLFLVGTKGVPEHSLTIDTTFAQWGYHAISLDYENNVVAVSCAHATDPACFDHYREAIVTGRSVSDKIQVDPGNSILNRFGKLLIYLAKNDPKGGWGQFLHHGQPVWSRIIVAGHSQGSGHAAYLGQMFPVDRVLMFSGPQDYLDDLHRPAPWLANPSATPPARFFAFLNLEDPFNVHHQIANCAVLMHTATPATLMVTPGEVIPAHYHILINDFPTKQRHGSTLFPQFENVWKYMATTPVS